jgi:hypothetical protein
MGRQWSARLDLGEHESPAMKDLQMFIMLRKSSGNWWVPFSSSELVDQIARG